MGFKMRNNISRLTDNYSVVDRLIRDNQILLGINVLCVIANIVFIAVSAQKIIEILISATK